jgi:hypothetical protein
MSLPDFVATGQPVEFLVPWLPDTLWIVPTERDLAALVAEGVSRGRIWTAAELLQLVAVATTDGEHGLRIVARAKLEFGGEIVAVMTRRRPGPSDRGRPEAH